MEFIVGAILVALGWWGGSEYEASQQPVVIQNPIVVIEKPELVSEEPVFEQGMFYQTTKGYYITDLSPRKELPEGCSNPLLTADLSEPRETENLDVQEVDVKCEEAGES